MAVTPAGGLTIGSVDMINTGWWIRNLHVLWMPEPQRGEDVLVPNVAGVRARRRRATAATKVLELVISGRLTYAGTTDTTPFRVLHTNVAFLQASVVAPTNTGDGTRTAVLTLPNATTLSEPVHVLGLEPVRTAENGMWMLAELELSIPSGRFQ